MSERRSRKRLFNIVDIIIILLVIVAGIVGAKLFLGGGAEEIAAGETKTYSYVVTGHGVVEETVNFPEIGGKAFNSSTSAYLGTVTEVSAVPYTETMYNRETEAYEKAVSMDITPEPDTIIRVNMLWYPSSTYVDMEPQDLTALNPSEREGFTVVEWGGEKYERGIFK